MHINEPEMMMGNGNCDGEAPIEGNTITVSTDTISSTDGQSGSVPFFNIGQERAEAAVALQKDLLEAYEQSSRAWLARVQSEVALWSELATKLTATRSVPEALAAYTKWYRSGCK